MSSSTAIDSATTVGGCYADGTMPNPSFAIVFGRYVVAAREALGLQQRQLAEKVKMSQGYLSEIEHGDKALTSDMIDRILDGLGVPVVAMADAMSSRSQPRNARRRSGTPRPPNQQ